MKAKKVLIHLIGNIGDVIVATSAVALLKKIHPEYEITMLARSMACELLENNPAIDHVMIMDYSSQSKSLGYMRQILRQIRQQHFDISISLDRKNRLAWITFLAGIPVRIGPDRIFQYKASRTTWLYTHVIHEPTDWFLTSQADLFQNVIRGYFHTEASALPVVAEPAASDVQAAESLLAELPRAGTNTRTVGLCIRGTLDVKNWPQEKFVQLVEQLAVQRDVRFYVVGSEQDHAYAQQFIQQVDVPVADFCGRTSLLALRALIARSDLFISIDTGVAHLAATTDTPLIAIYMCYVQHHWRAMTDKLVPVISPKDLSQGCPEQLRNQDMCPYNQYHCVERIAVEPVLSAALKLL